MPKHDKWFEQEYYQQTAESYREFVRLIIDKPEMIEPDLAFVVEHKIVTSGGPFGVGGPYGYSCIVYKDLNDNYVVVYVAETVSVESQGVNHPMNVLGHLVDMKVQKETGLKLDGCSRDCVRGILVCRSLEYNRFKETLRRNGLEYKEIPQSDSPL